MSDPDAARVDATGRTHEAAAEAFARRVRDADGLEELLCFGSTARGEAAGLDSDVDFLAVVSDDVDRTAVADALRAEAYDVMLEYGPVVEVHVLARSTFATYREADHPFVTRLLREGEQYV